jgi:hypothetical protein
VRAALVVWLPALAPLASGTLRGCGDCQTRYLLALPTVPGVLVPVLCGLDDAWFFLAGGVAALGLFGLVALCLHELPRLPARVVQVLVVLAVAGEAIGFAHALRA